jgi:hypothetical protein
MGQVHALAAGAGLAHDHHPVVLEHRVQLGAQVRELTVTS